MRITRFKCHFNMFRYITCPLQGSVISQILKPAADCVYVLSSPVLCVAVACKIVKMWLLDTQSGRQL